MEGGGLPGQAALGMDRFSPLGVRTFYWNFFWGGSGYWRCFCHLLLRDSGACAATVSGFVKKGSGDRNITGSLAFLQPYLILSSWGCSCVHPRPQIPHLLAVSGGSNNLFWELWGSLPSSPPLPGDGRWPTRNLDDLLAKSTSLGPHDVCLSGTQKRNVTPWLLGRGGILLWLWQQANRCWLWSLPASLVQHAFFFLLRDVPPSGE